MRVPTGFIAVTRCVERVRQGAVVRRLRSDWRAWGICPRRDRSCAGRRG